MQMRTARALRFISRGWPALVLAFLLAPAVRGDIKPPSETEPMKGFAPYLVGRDLPESIRKAEEEGSLSKAEKEIDERLKEKDLDSATAETLRNEQERLKRLRRDFSLTPETMLEKLRKSIPEVTAVELEQYRKDGAIQWLQIDGEVRYFRREPSNLFRFSRDARTRRDRAEKKAAAQEAAQATATPVGDPSAKTGKGFSIEDHAADIVEAMEKSDAVELLPVRLRARHTITVHPGVVPEGKTIRCWIPYPEEYRQQKDVKFVSSSPEKHVIAPNGAPHRTIYLEQAAPAPDKPTNFVVEYEYTISSYAPKVDPDKVKPINPDDPELKPYLGDDPPHLVVTPEIRHVAQTIVGDESNPYRKAEKIFRWMDTNIRYASEMEYSVMPSVTEKVSYTWKGDCGVHVLMFAALCRARGVPARWQSGWATRPGNWNLHDWAEFYIPPYGWLPADPSFGLRKSDDTRVRDYYFGHLDSYRMIANLGFDAPFDPPKKFWRSDTVDNQRGEVEWEGGNLYYDDWDYDVEIDYLEQYRSWGKE